MKSTIGIGVGIAALLAGACVSSSDSAPPAPTGNLPCDVDAILAKNCRQCHGDPASYGAPMPLTSLGSVHAAAKLTPGKKVFETIGARIHDDASPMPQPPNARLSAADTATLDTWIAAGAPAGSTSCAATPDAGSGGPTPLACDPDQKIRPASKFEMTQATDLYVCYGFDTQATEKRHVIAGTPRIDNTNIVHHILVYQADETVSSTPQPCSGGGKKNWRLVTGWAPGAKNFELPPEAGFAEDVGTTHWVMQIHYNNAQGLTGQVDESGFDLCSTDQLRPNDADIFATGTFEISIPPRSTYETDCELSVPEAFGRINVISTWAHMHRLGSAQSATRVRNGQETTLLDSPAYDFSTGATANPVNVDVASGDTIRTMCRWKNTGDATVEFGEGTADEMCFAFMTYYPKITIPKFTWALPAALSKCTAKTL